MARLSVITGFLLIVTLAFVAVGGERRPAVLGVAVGAVLLLLPAPWHWRSAGYVAALGFAVFFSNNAAEAADRPWRGWPLALLAFALFTLSTWMGTREDQADEPPKHSARSAAPSRRSRTIS